MKIAKLVFIVLFVSLIYNCQNEKSLQQFIIEQQEKSDIISFDLSSSLLTISDNLENEDDIEALKSLKKINILAYKIKDSTNNHYLTDKEHVNKILKQEKYAELVRYGKGSQAAKFYLVGDKETIDELIIFANDKNLGWLIIRILGENMQPDKILQLVQKVDFTDKDINLLQFKDLLNN